MKLFSAHNIMTFKCDKETPFHECELALLRNAVDKAEDIKGYELTNSNEIKDMISVVEQFIKKKSLVCYGGTAINNILPEADQFYDKNKEIPDYDFFSPTAMDDAIELADIYNSMGYDEVEAKAGQHYGTYKVFVNYIPIADITQIDSGLYSTLKRDAIRVSNILYTPPNMLRMSMFLELSRPAGDISRWEKVLKRLTLLNKHYPLTDSKCDYSFFSRKMEQSKKKKELFHVVRDYLASNDVVFFGGWATSVYAKHMNATTMKTIQSNPDFDVISVNAEQTASFLKSTLESMGYNNISIAGHSNLDEIIPKHYEVKVGKDTVAFIYQTIACYSYNIIHMDNKKYRIATIDTMLSMYLAFLYAGRKYYDEQRIICMANFLFKIQQKNRLSQKGVLRRFTINCYGTQPTKESMRAAKSKKFEELKHNRNSKEFQRWFLNYKPTQGVKLKIETKKQQKVKTMKRAKKTKSSKTVRNSIKRLLKPLLS